MSCPHGRPAGVSAPPEDVRLTGLLLRTESEGGAPIARPGHFQDTPMALDGLDAETGPKFSTSSQVSHHQLHGINELMLLGIAKFCELAQELHEFIVRWHPPSWLRIARAVRWRVESARC